jgi:hypothetical protein
MELIRQRKLTPWILMKSARFKQLLVRGSEEEVAIFQNLIRPPYWRYKFDKSPETVEIMEQLVASFNL